MPCLELDWALVFLLADTFSRILIAHVLLFSNKAWGLSGSKTIVTCAGHRPPSLTADHGPPAAGHRPQAAGCRPPDAVRWHKEKL